jgi:RNA polymerase sigma-70 factor (ECF subfamily)
VGDALTGLGEIYDAYAPKIFQYIYHRLGDQALAEDLTGEVFVRFLHARATPDRLTAFLYRIAHNLIVDYLRRHPRTLSLDEEVADDRPGPLYLAQVEMERLQVRRALARLTPDQQQVIVLKFLEGFSNEEIAHIVGKPVGAVKSLQHRGLATLRDLLSPEILREMQLEEAG